MATPRILIDTSIIIEHLRKQNRQKSILYNIANQYELYTSTVVEFELYTGATTQQKQQDIRAVLAWTVVLPFTSETAQTAAFTYQQLKAQNQLIDMRDILIAATALTNGLPLMTLNVGHFNRISGLKLMATPQL